MSSQSSANRFTVPRQALRCLALGLMTSSGLISGCDVTEVVLGDAQYNAALDEEVASSPAALRLEERVAKHPEDVEARGRLLELYEVQRHVKEEVKQKYNTHLLYLIEHAPDSEALPGVYFFMMDEELLPVTKPMWEAHINGAYSTNPLVIKRAADTFSVADPALSEHYLKKGMDLEPSNFWWPDQMGQLYKLRALSLEGEVDRVKAEKMLRLFENAYSLASGNDKRWLTLEAAWAAALAGEEATARKYVALLPRTFPDPADKGYAKSVHYREIILGLLALDAGNLAAAEEHLLKAGEAPASGLLSSHGPNMLVALRLLKQGRRDVVLQYMDKCRHFWVDDAGMLEQWRADVEAGKIPQFVERLYL